MSDVPETPRPAPSGETPEAAPEASAARSVGEVPEASAATSVGEVPEASAAPSSADGAEAALAHVDADWRRVSPKYVVVEVIGSLIGAAVLIGGLLVAAVLGAQQWAFWIAGAVAVGAVVTIAFEPRRVRSIAYRLRADDLVFKRGIMFQRQVAVPYGRMQLVDITRGPIARAMGLADLKFVTAAAATAVTVPGLPAEEADRLRDELVALAETRRAGL
jgi:membrane protein YdbS with pleckstrin-like domain